MGVYVYTILSKPIDVVTEDGITIRVGLAKYAGKPSFSSTFSDHNPNARIDRACTRAYNAWQHKDEQVPEFFTYVDDDRKPGDGENIITNPHRKSSFYDDMTDSRVVGYLKKVPGGWKMISKKYHQPMNKPLPSKPDEVL